MGLEDLYLGIPDESVNLTFKDLAELTQNSKPISEKKIPTTMKAIPGSNIPKKGSPTTSLKRAPGLDFNKGLEASNYHLHPDDHHDLDHHVKIRDNTSDFHGSSRAQDHLHGLYAGGEIGRHQGHATPEGRFRHVADYHHLGDGRSSFAYDEDVSVIGMASVYQERRQKRRPAGIPHSNICTVCSTYVYIFRQRCLVRKKFTF